MSHRILRPCIVKVSVLEKPIRALVLGYFPLYPNNHFYC